VELSTRLKRLVCVVAVVFAAAGCQHQSITTASDPVDSSQPAVAEVLPGGTTVRFVSAETGVAVFNANVRIGGASYFTSGDGIVRLTHAVALPVSLEAASADYLLRETVIQSAADLRVSLWPRSSATGLTETLTRALVYTDAASGSTVRLRRPQGARVTIVPDALVWEDAEALAAHHAAANALGAATRNAVVFDVREGAGTGTVVRTTVDADDPAMAGRSALAYRTTAGNSITSGKIAFRTLEVARMATVVTHEVAHTFGLEHSSDPADLMYPIVTAESKTLSARERLVIELMLLRRPGNQFPDNDRDSVTAQGERVERIACGDGR
jgi:hypothetical protein